jgi:hypothetical protein
MGRNHDLNRPFAYSGRTHKIAENTACNDLHINHLDIHTNSIVRFDNPDNFT